MATERQIAANRENAKRSTGPSPEGLLKTRLNATRHGMAATLPAVEAGLSPEFEERRELWVAEQAPTNEKARFALDRAVAASLRIERCEKAIDGLIADSRLRAGLAWDEDRAAEAAVLFGRLSKNPLGVSKQLQTTLAGTELMMEAWLGLTSALQSGRDWTEAEASMALDLLGASPVLRSGRTAIDPIDDSDPIAFRLDLAKGRFEHLDQLREHALIPLEEVDRRRALAGDLAFQSKTMQRLLRYERDAWRRYREANRQEKAEPTAILPARPAAVAPKKPPEPPRLPEESPVEAGLRKSAPIRAALNEELADSVFEDDEAWAEEIERRTARWADDFVAIAAGRPATERSQFEEAEAG